MIGNDLKELNLYSHFDYILNQPKKYELDEYYSNANAGFYRLSVGIK